MNATRELFLAALLLEACTTSKPQPVPVANEPIPPPIVTATASTAPAPPPSHEPLIREYQALARKPATASELDAFIQDHPALLTAEAHPYGPTLMWVLEFEEEEGVLALIRAGAKIPPNALALAARGGLDGLIDVLLQKGANPNGADDWGYTPLHLAAKYGHTSTIRKLIAAKALPSVKASNDGFTPLHIAVMERKEEAVAALIAAKADLEARDNRGRTPLHWGPFAYIPQAKHIYRDIGEPHDTVFTDPGPAKTIGMLLDAGAKIDAVDDEGNTALHDAARLASVRGAQMLLARGAKTSVKNKAGETPLSIAKASDHRAEIAKMLEGRR